MNKMFYGDCRNSLKKLYDDGVRAQMCVTSPPYFGLRDYGVDGQIGMEQSPEEYVQNLVEVFRAVRDVLTSDGTLWVNIGDSYGKNKQILGIPWRVAFALQEDGWILRQDIIWHKPNPMPESVLDRCTKAHEYIFLLSKKPKYFINHESMREPASSAPKKSGKKNDASRNDSNRTGIVRGDGETRNRRSVWTVASRPYKGAHFAVFPPPLIEPCILAGSLHGDIVLDPFMGSGTTAQVALQHGRQYIGCELNEDYAPLINSRINSVKG